MKRFITVLLITGCSGPPFSSGLFDDPEAGFDAGAPVADAAPPPSDAELPDAGSGGASSIEDAAPASGGRLAASGGSPSIASGGQPTNTCKPGATRCASVSAQETCDNSGWGETSACPPCADPWVPCCLVDTCACVSSVAVCVP